MMEKGTLPIDAIAVVGPTASGKTSLSIELARRLDTEIVSCDSMQIYRGMDIGTAKATEEERRIVPHHLIDILSPNAPYSAADYGEDAYKIALSLAKRAKTPIFCGGTGLYLNAACRAVHENPSTPNSDVRLRLQKVSEEENGYQALFNMLCKERNVLLGCTVDDFFECVLFDAHKKIEYEYDFGDDRSRKNPEIHKT